MMYKIGKVLKMKEVMKKFCPFSYESLYGNGQSLPVQPAFRNSSPTCAFTSR